MAILDDPNNGTTFPDWQDILVIKEENVHSVFDLPDYAAFLRTICLYPFDEVPKLIFADYLAENDFNDEAELIRGTKKWYVGRPMIGKVPDSGIKWKDKRNGFLCAIELTCELFLQHAKELFEKNPITEVNLNIPYRNIGYPLELENAYAKRWRRSVDLDYAEKSDLLGYESPQLKKRLSIAWVDYARELCDLRPINWEVPE